MKERWKIVLMIIIFLLFYFLPFGNPMISGSINEAFLLTQEYAQQHVLLCLVPAFFIAGAIAIFVSQKAVIKYFGAQANKILSYSVASVSGTILAVCSCTVLPIFAGIYLRGAGIGPATAFLYSGPAINVLAIIFTARVLGIELGIARIVGAVLFSVIIGLLMHFIFLKEEKQRDNRSDNVFEISHEEQESRPLWKSAIFFALMVGILVFANWAKDETMEVWQSIYQIKWVIASVLMIVLVFVIFRWFKKDEIKEWALSSWGFGKQIFPLLIGGVIVAGFLLGRPGHNGIIPGGWVENLVGGNSVWSNLFASVFGAFMYFATLTEVPIVQGLMGAGMGKGPALALLLAGPALSLPSMIVIRSILGTKKAFVYILLVVIMATITGMIFGSHF